MSDDVTIPRDRARVLAEYHRERSRASRHVVSEEAAAWHRETADLLDPPPSIALRAAWQLVDWAATARPGDDALPSAEKLLATIADWLAEQPLNGSCDGIQLTCGNQREHDVRLLRSASGDDRTANRGGAS